MRSFIKRIANGNLRGAARAILEANPQRELQPGELNQHSGGKVSTAHADWTGHANNPLRT